jgi:uncharacterized protein YecT (DUF1311 family)
VKPRIPSLGAALVALISLMPASAAQPQICSDSLSTVEHTRCVRTELAQKDKQLQQAMQTIASDAAAVPSEQFPLLWSDTLTGFFKTSADPQQQFEQFKAARLKACAYMNSLAFQGTGFGIFVGSCEIRLTDGLLKSLGN